MQYKGKIKGKREKYLEKEKNFLVEKPFLHRGWHDIEKGIPENSMKSFLLAMAEGYPIELDVHLLKDGTLVVIHDNNLKRLTGINKKLKDCTYEEIRNLTLENTQEKIPLFREVLEAINGKVALDIEVKIDQKANLIAPAVARMLDSYTGNFLITSFNPFILEWFKKHRPQYIRGQLVSNHNGDKIPKIVNWVLKNMLFNFITKPEVIACNIKMLPSKEIQREKEYGKIIIGWTVKTEEDREIAEKYCDNYILDI